jgi:hypothetical protein
MKATAKYLYSLNFELHLCTSNVVSFLNLQIFIDVYQNSDIILKIAKFEVLKAMLFKIQAFCVAVVSDGYNYL